MTPPLQEGGVSPGLRRYLGDQEVVVAEVRWHPVKLLRATLALLVWVALIGWVASGLRPGAVLESALAPALLGGVAWYGWRVLEWRTERLLVTDRRLLMITGLLSRRVAVMPLRKVTDMTFEQPLVGRLFDRAGWGTFVFESAGQDQAFHRVKFLPRPDELYRKLTDQIFGEHGIYGRKPAPRTSTFDRRDDEE